MRDRERRAGRRVESAQRQWAAALWDEADRLSKLALEDGRKLTELGISLRRAAARRDGTRVLSLVRAMGRGGARDEAERVVGHLKEARERGRDEYITHMTWMRDDFRKRQGRARSRARLGRRYLDLAIALARQ